MSAPTSARALPEGWVSATVGELGEYVNGLAFRPTDWSADGRPIIRIQNLTDSTRPYNYTTREVPDRVVVRNGDILVSWSATLDAFVWRGPEAVLNQHIFRVLPNSRVQDSRFLLWALKAAIAELSRGEHAHGSTMQHVNRGPFLAHPIAIPPDDRQKAIADEIEVHVSRLDSTRDTLERISRNLGRYQASLLKAAVEGRLVTSEAEISRSTGRPYESAREFVEKVSEARRPKPMHGRTSVAQPGLAPANTRRHPELPEGWLVTRLEEVADVSGGLTKNARRESLPTQVPYLRVANVYAGELRLDDVTNIGVSAGELKRVLLERDDMLLVEGNGSAEQIGRVAVWDGSISPCVHQNHIIKTRFFDASMAHWAVVWLSSPGGREAIGRVASSTSGLHTLSLSRVRALPIPIPPPQERRRILTELSKQRSILAATSTAVDLDLKRISVLHSSVLQSAFRGELA